MADLTAETVADGTLEEQLRYWQQQRAKSGGVKEVRTRDKTIVYDTDWITNEIARIEAELRRSGASRVAYTSHCRR